MRDNIKLKALAISIGMPSNDNDASYALNEGNQILSALDRLISLGLLLGFGKLFATKREKRGIEDSEEMLAKAGLYYDVNKRWERWRDVAERYVRRKWGFSREYREFVRRNRVLNQLFYQETVGTLEIKATFSDQLSSFKTLIEAKPPPWWKNIPRYLYQLVIDVILRMAGK